MSLEFRLRVYYEDTDAGGIVYYANYLKFIERARTEALLAAGMSQTELRARLGIVFAVREVTVSYLAPARLEDELVVRTRVAPPGGRAARHGAGGLARGDLPGAGAGDAGLHRAGGARRRGYRRRCARRWRGCPPLARR